MSDAEHRVDMATVHVRGAVDRTSRTDELTQFLREFDDCNQYANDMFQGAADRIELYEALLREALIWCPRLPTYPPTGKRQANGTGWCDLANRIEAALEGKP